MISIPITLLLSHHSIIMDDIVNMKYLNKSAMVQAELQKSLATLIQKKKNQIHYRLHMSLK